MTETKKTTPRKPVEAPKADLTAKAILFAAFLRKGYNQVTALQATEQVYAELDKA